MCHIFIMYNTPKYPSTKVRFEGDSMCVYPTQIMYNTPKYPSTKVRFEGDSMCVYPTQIMYNTPKYPSTKVRFAGEGICVYSQVGHTYKMYNTQKYRLTIEILNYDVICCNMHHI